MNLQQLRDNKRLCEKLASEYVLGTLRGAARRRFERWLKEDRTLQASVAAWQDRLLPLAQFAPAAQPSPDVWQTIERKIGATATTSERAGFWRKLREDLAFWRGLGMASTVIAAILATVLLTRQPEPIIPVTSYVATLTDDKAQPIAIVTGDAQRRRMTVKLIAPQTIAADKSLELWAVPKQGAPRSLGLLTENVSVTLPLPEDADPGTAPLLAISLEPKGGSRDPKGPSGPILFKGAWVQI